MIFGYLFRRFLQMILVVVGVSFIAFFLLFLGGDAALLMVGEDWTVTQVEEFREQMGFNRPWYIQYFQFAGNAVRGDLGKSLRAHQSVSSLLKARMPATFKLAGLAVLISIIISIPLGVLAATHRGTIFDNGAVILSMIGQAFPVFVLGMLLLLLFGVTWKILPISGSGSWKNLVLPAVTLSSLFTARVSRIVRSSVLEVLGTDYIRTARAKGLSERIVVYVHALKNAMIPVITMIGMQFGYLLGGAIITESIFAYPGMGLLVLDAVYNRDFPVVQGVVIFLAITFVAINFFVDLCYALLDPRVRLS